MDWKWSNGTIMERSPRIQQSEPIQQPQQMEQVPKAIIENNAYLQSLNCDYGFGPSMAEDYEFRETNKREDSYNKMAERQMVAQIGLNPFLENNTNYVEDVSIRDQYLKPVCTNNVDKFESAPEPAPSSSSQSMGDSGSSY